MPTISVHYLRFVVLATLMGALSPVLASTIISSTDVPKTIPDLGTATSTLTAPNLVITDVNLILNDLRHTSILDLAIELTSPSGTTKLLIASFTPGGILSSLADARVDLVGTIFDDQAPVNLLAGVTPAGNSPFPGSFNIDHPTVGNSPLSAFNGQNALGVWTLTVRDELGSDSGVLNAWSLEFTSDVAVPEPATVSVVALGLAGLGMTRFRSSSRTR